MTDPTQLLKLLNAVLPYILKHDLNAATLLVLAVLILVGGAVALASIEWRFSLTVTSRKGRR